MEERRPLEISNHPDPKTHLIDPKAMEKRPWEIVRASLEGILFDIHAVLTGNDFTAGPGHK